MPTPIIETRPQPIVPPAGASCPVCKRTVEPSFKYCVWCGSALPVPPPASAKVEARPARVKPLVFDVPRRDDGRPWAIRKAFYESGLALTANGRHKEALAEFDRAIREQDEGPADAEVCIRSAQSAEQAGQGERAVRSYLEAILLAPAGTREVLEHVHGMLTPAVVRKLGPWIAGEWGERANAPGVPAADRARVAVLMGFVDLLQAEYKRALDRFKEAMKLDPGSKEDIPEALQMVEQALKIGFAGDDFPDAPARWLKAELHEALGQGSEAAREYSEAGRRYGWRNDNETAARLLGRAVELDPEDVVSYWYLMESLRMLGRIEEGLAAWEQGRKRCLPAKEYAWAFVSRALINESLLVRVGADAWSLGWEAAGLIECSLVLAPEDTFAWTMLSHFHRLLWRTANAVLDGERVLDLKKEDDPIALDELAAVKACSGAFDDARKIVERRLKHGRSEMSDWIQAFVLVVSGRWEEARKRADDVLRDQPGNIWALDIRSFCSLELGDTARMREDAEQIMKRYPPAEPWDLSTFCIVAYRLGDWQTSIDILERMGDAHTQDAGFADLRLGLCRLAQGHLEEGERLIKKGAENTSIAFALAVFEKVELPFVERALADHPDRKLLAKVLDSLSEAIRKRRETIEARPRTPEDELSDVIGRTRRAGPAAEVVTAGARAGLARLLGSKGLWEQAAGAYQALLDKPEHFPLARQALAHALDRLQDAGCELVRQAKPDADAALIESYRPALAIAEKSSADLPGRTGILRARIGYAHFLLGKMSDAEVDFREALQAIGGDGPVEAGRRMADACRRLLTDPARYWALRSAWERIIGLPDLDGSARRGFSAALEALEPFLGAWFGLDDSAGPGAGEVPWKAVDPIQLRLDWSIIPPDTSAAGWPLLGTYIPDLRARIRNELGVVMPSVRILDLDQETAASVAPNKYQIRLHEANPVVGRVPEGQVYCLADPKALQALNIPRGEIVEATNPLTGWPGGWVPTQYERQVKDSGVEVWTDRYRFIVAHLEALVRPNLAGFLGIDDGPALLKKSASPETSRALTELVSDPDHRRRLSRVLRALVFDGVPITDGQQIVEALASHGLADDDVAEAVRVVRLRLKRQLPGNEPGALRLPLPPDLEQRLERGLRPDKGKPCFTLPRSEVPGILNELRALAVGLTDRPAVVTRPSSLREPLQYLLRAAFPFAAPAALWHDEVLEPLPPDAPHTAKNGKPSKEVP